MARVLAVSPNAVVTPGAAAIPALALLAHTVVEMLPDASIVTEAQRVDLVVVMAAPT